MSEIRDLEHHFPNCVAKKRFALHFLRLNCFLTAQDNATIINYAKLCIRFGIDIEDAHALLQVYIIPLVKNFKSGIPALLKTIILTSNF
jgi:hypothetical protein